MNEIFAKDVNSLEGFDITAITNDVFSRIVGKSYAVNCTVSRDELRYLRLLHKNLSGETLRGEMICNRRIAADVLEIFERLFVAGYPIERVRLIDEYGADDELSMRDNNSSSFCFRTVSFTNRISRHGYGLAVDINPRYNPYIKTVDGKKIIAPDNGAAYQDRTKDFPYKITAEDLCCRLFKAHGFTWGGDCWDDELDYQHFFIEED